MTVLLHCKETNETSGIELPDIPKDKLGLHHCLYESFCKQGYSYKEAYDKATNEILGAA